MNSNQFNQLASAEDATQFKQSASSIGIEVAGPSKRGSMLVLDIDGRAWLFSKHHGECLNPLAKLRTYAPSVWSDLNVLIMKGGE